jgi:hypothetical protein
MSLLGELPRRIEKRFNGNGAGAAQGGGSLVGVASVNGSKKSSSG